MQYISAKAAAQKWGLTVRRVQDLCKSHAIDGAVRWGRDWMIPADANRPEDRRKKLPDTNVVRIADLPRKNPVIIMSNIYNTPGTADEVADSMEDQRPIAARLFRAQIAYCRGELESCINEVNALLQLPRGHDLQIGCGVLLGMCAIAIGDYTLWGRAKEQIKSARCRDLRDKHALDFWISTLECELRETNTFPEWFSQGRFDVLPGDSFPPARFYYIRYLYIISHKTASGMIGDADAQKMMGMVPCVAEPLIAQNSKEGALVSEIYSRLMCAMAYHNLGNDAMAVHHVDIAIQKALPDRLFMPLAEYRRPLDFLLDDRLGEQAPEVLTRVKALQKKYQAGWEQLYTRVRGRSFVGQLTVREREVAKLACFGLSNKEIADRLKISVNTVKQSLRLAMDKTGAMSRSELAIYL